MVLVLILFQLPMAFACKCVIPGPELKTEINKTEIIFLGQCIGSEFITGEESNSDRGYTVRYFFKVEQKFKGISTKNITVETGMGLGDCGFEFRPGFLYLIYAHIDNSIVHTYICTRTKIAGFFPDRLTDDVETEIGKIKEFLNQE